MKLLILFDPSTGVIQVQAEDLADRGTALDLLEMARAAIHQQGAAERQKNAIVVATASALPPADHGPVRGPVRGTIRPNGRG